jgi:proteasome component ECM29
MTVGLQETDAYLSNTQLKQREKQSQITAEYAATVSLGWLVKYGLNQSAAEATGICISCLLGIVDVAKPSTLQPVLPELIGSLLMAMSGLEPAALNYLQVRAAGNDTTQSNSGPDRYDQLERLRINLALSGPIADVSGL